MVEVFEVSIVVVIEKFIITNKIQANNVILQGFVYKYYKLKKSTISIEGHTLYRKCQRSFATQNS